MFKGLGNSDVTRHPNDERFQTERSQLVSTNLQVPMFTFHPRPLARGGKFLIGCTALLRSNFRRSYFSQQVWNMSTEKMENIFARWEKCVMACQVNSLTSFRLDSATCPRDRRSARR